MSEPRSSSPRHPMAEALSNPLSSTSSLPTLTKSYKSHDTSTTILSEAVSSEQHKRNGEEEEAPSTTNVLLENKTVLLVSLLVFAVLCASGIGLATAYSHSQQAEKHASALDVALETGRFFREELNKATAPLVSLATMVAEVPEFHNLSHSVETLPMKTLSHRNLTNSLCEDTAINARFDQVAARIKRNARMEGVLVLLELVPQAVVCLVYPKNNTEDFEPPIYYDPTGSWGLDLLSDPFRWHGETTLKNGDAKVTIAGPMKLKNCWDCHPSVEQAFMARLPVSIPGYYIDVPSSVPGEQPTRYPYWGFAVTKLNWKALVEKSGIYRTMEDRGHSFRMTRVDSIFNTTSGQYTKQVKVLAESPNYHTTIHHDDQQLTYQLTKGYSVAHTALNATDNEWEMSVTYQSKVDWEWWVLTLIVLLSLGVACLVFVVLLQKHQKTKMMGHALAQETMVKTERGMTSYFAHELRNPLSAIDSALKAMPDDLPEDAQELLAGMKLCSNFMSGVMNNLLDVRQIEEGKMTLHWMPLNLEALVEDMHRMFLPSVHASVRFQWKSNIRKDEPNWVVGDIHRIQQVFTNVVSNALKYTKTGSITLTIGWEKVTSCVEQGANNMHRIRFECADTGPGIPKHIQAQLFQRFARRGGAPGTGLGLAISKRLVDLMQGTIHFESDPTREPGATCIVVLPLKPCVKPDDESSDSGCSKKLGEGSHSTSKTLLSDSSSKNAASQGPIQEEISILITDDIKMNRMMLKKRILKLIAPNGIISEATTGEEAVEICKRDTFDVIIMDQYMESAGGVLLGTDAVIALKRMNVASLLIGCSGNDIAQEFKDAGADYCWQKPLPSNETIIKQLRISLARERFRDRSRKESAASAPDVVSKNSNTTSTPPTSSSGGLFAIPPPARTTNQEAPASYGGLFAIPPPVKTTVQETPVSSSGLFAMPPPAKTTNQEAPASYGGLFAIPPPVQTTNQEAPASSGGLFAIPSPVQTTNQEEMPPGGLFAIPTPATIPKASASDPPATTEDDVWKDDVWC